MVAEVNEIDEDLLIDQIKFKSSHTDYGINQVLQREYNDIPRREGLLKIAEKIGFEIEEDWISGHTQIDENHTHYWYPFDVEHDEVEDIRAWYRCDGRDCPYERYICIKMDAFKLRNPTIVHESVWDTKSALCAGGTQDNPCRKHHSDCNIYHDEWIGWRCKHDFDWKEYRIEDRYLSQFDRDLEFFVWSDCEKCGKTEEKLFDIKQDVIPDLQPSYSDHVHKWEWEDNLERDEDNELKLDEVIINYSCIIEGCSVQDKQMRLPLGQPKINVVRPLDFRYKMENA